VATSDPSQGARSGVPAEAPQQRRDSVVGVLLCGGRSARMGSDKARLELDGSALMDYPLRALRDVTDRTVLACGPVPRYLDLGLDLALDPTVDGGPLAGLVAGLDAARERGAEWAAVLACDMPEAEGSLLARLLERAEASDSDACLLGLARGSQPTYGVYHVRCAAPARAALEAGERRLIAFHGASVEGRPLRVEIVRAGELGARDEVARNVNTPEELAAARASGAREAAR
jgi:molybdopterin-guanine dinucleotide biosynthesis protein A